MTMMMMMMMTMMTNTIPYRRKKKHIWDKVLMGIWVHPVIITFDIITIITKIIITSSPTAMSPDLSAAPPVHHSRYQDSPCVVLRLVEYKFREDKYKYTSEQVQRQYVNNISTTLIVAPTIGSAFLSPVNVS